MLSFYCKKVGRSTTFNFTTNNGLLLWGFPGNLLKLSSQQFAETVSFEATRSFHYFENIENSGNSTWSDFSYDKKCSDYSKINFIWDVLWGCYMVIAMYYYSLWNLEAASGDVL